MLSAVLTESPSITCCYDNQNCNHHHYSSAVQEKGLSIIPFVAQLINSCNDNIHVGLQAVLFISLWQLKQVVKALIIQVLIIQALITSFLHKVVEKVCCHAQQVPLITV